jgi:hypothetical protein
MKIKNISQYLFLVAGSLTILGAVLQLFVLNFAPYIFSAGAGLLIFLHAKEVFDDKLPDKRHQRQSRIGLITSLFLGLGAYFMFTGSNSWVVMILIYSLSSFFQSFRGNK